MKFALLGNERIVAQPHIKGAICPKCRTEVISKCGEIRVNHWAHKNKIQCDKWMEDSEWREKWLDEFPSDWQEPVIDRGTESHFVDIRTPNNTMILLHQSHLTVEIVRERETFYSTPVWIINAGRYKNSVNRFLSCFEKSYIKEPKRTPENLRDPFLLLSEFNVDKVFHRSWLSCHFPVFLDYTTATAGRDHRYAEQLDYLWCLMPYSVQGFRILFKFTKQQLIEKLIHMKGRTLEEMKQLEQTFIKNHPHLY